MTAFGLLTALLWPPLAAVLCTGRRLFPSLMSFYGRRRMLGLSWACSGLGIILAAAIAPLPMPAGAVQAGIGAVQAGTGLAIWRRAALPRARGPPGRPCQRARPAAGSTALPALYPSLPLRHHRAPGGRPAPPR